MIIIDDTTVVVYTPAELASAISADNGINYVYLGDNIIMTSGIRIHPTKLSLVIDGIYPPEDTNFHTLTDSGGDLGMIYIDAASYIDLTFQNLIIAGRNYYGMPRVFDIAGNENVSVTYRNVTYTGPQMTWHVRGLTRYIDCDITILYSGYSAMQEVGEVCRVEIGGKTTIRHNATGYAAFYFYKTNASFTVLEDANVDVTTECDFLYNEYSTQFTIQPRASLTLTTRRSCSRDSGHQVTSFLVDKDASFRYIRNTNEGGTHALYVEGAFTVNEGASIYMQSALASTGALIRFTTSLAGLYLNNPKSFVLYDSGTVTAATSLSFAYSTQFAISGGQLNFWLNATPFPDAGTFADIPLHKWFKPDWSQFTVTGTVTSGQTTVSGSSFTPEELSDLPALEAFNLHLARALSVGDLPITANPVIDDGRPITGRTEPGANMVIEYTVGGQDYSLEETSDADGRFSVLTPGIVPVGTAVAIASNLPFLITRITTPAVEAGELLITSSPERIVFKTRPILTSPVVLLPRSIPEEPVTVHDTRAESTEWELLASITGHLETASGETLEDAVVFKNDAGDIVTLSEQPVVVYTGGPDEERTNVFWTEEKGILVRVTEPIHSGVEYSTHLIWVLRII